jgi:exopolysaccharide biosynthesis polyprenyl glycosylphosphotransferase
MSSSRPDLVAVALDPAHDGLPTRAAGRSAGERLRLRGGRVRALVVADLIALVAAGVGAYGVANALAPPAVIAPSAAVAGLAVGAALMWVVVMSLYGLYERQTRTIAASTFDEVTTLLNALLAGSLLLLVAGQGLKRVADVSVYSPMDAALFLAFAVVLVPLARWAVRAWVLPTIVRPRRTLIVGAGPVGRMVQRKISVHPEYGLEVVGFVDDEAQGPGDEVLGRTDDLTAVVDEHEVDWVVLAGSDAPYERTLELVRAVRRPDVHLSIVPSYFELFASNATIEDLEGVPVVSLPPMRLSRSVRVLKRSFDIAGSAVGLLALAPLFAVAAVAIKLGSPGPVFFRQLRNGRGGVPFRIVKFRTMVDGAEAQRFDIADLNQVDGPLFKMRSDPRVTRVGAVLRGWRIDELPQLLNVLRGEMSLVGPRPFVVHEADRITGWAGRRLESTPGMTGLWQVLGGSDLPFDEMVKLDYIYVTNWSLWWDIKILCQTIPLVLGRRGAY